jgi:hypothetical protein
VKARPTKVRWRCSFIVVVLECYVSSAVHTHCARQGLRRAAMRPAVGDHSHACAHMQTRARARTCAVFLSRSFSPRPFAMLCRAAEGAEGEEQE